MLDRDDIPYLTIRQDLAELCYEANQHSDPNAVMREFFELVLSVIIAGEMTENGLVQVVSAAARRVRQEAALSR